MDNKKNAAATGNKTPEITTTQANAAQTNSTEATSTPGADSTGDAKTAEATKAPEATGDENVIFASNLINSGSITNVVWIGRSKRGIPCLYESGGGYTNTGAAQIIADRLGYPKRAIYIRTSGNLACQEHALIPVGCGDHIVTVKRHREHVAIRVDRIESIEENTASLVMKTEPICFDAINAAIEKSNDYHCRQPYYIR